MACVRNARLGASASITESRSSARWPRPSSLIRTQRCGRGSACRPPEESSIEVPRRSPLLSEERLGGELDSEVWARWLPVLLAIPKSSFGPTVVTHELLIEALERAGEQRDDAVRLYLEESPPRAERLGWRLRRLTDLSGFDFKPLILQPRQRSAPPTRAARRPARSPAAARRERSRGSRQGGARCGPKGRRGRSTVDPSCLDGGGHHAASFSNRDDRAPGGQHSRERRGLAWSR